MVSFARGRRFHDGLTIAGLLAAPAGFVLVFLAYPLGGMLRESFFRAGVGVDDIRPLWEDAYFRERAWFTLWQAVASTGITLILAMPAAWAMAKLEFRGKSLVVALVTVPFVLPTVVVAVAFTALVGPQGAANSALQWLFGIEEPPIDLLNSIWIILLAHVFYNVAMAARMIGAAWAGVDQRIEDAAAVLGSGRWETLLRVTLPLLRPAILAAASLVFLFCFTSFGVVLILGGSRYGTIETEVYRQTAFLFHLPLAATLALLQLGFTFLVMATYTHFERGVAGEQAGKTRRLPGHQGLLAAMILLALVALTVLPLAALAERSVHGTDGYTLQFYRELGQNAAQSVVFVEPFAAIRHSLGFALATMLLAVPLGTLGAYGSVRSGRAGNWVQAALLIPLGVSAVTLGLGFLVTFDKPPLNLRGTWMLVVIAHTLVAYPFVMRAVAVDLRSMNPRLREAARVLGANPVRVFMEVDLPLIWRSLAVGGVFAFATSLGEFGATLLIARPEWATIPVAIFRFLGRPGSLNYGQALAMSTILMVVATAGFVLIDRLRFRQPGPL